MSSVDDRIVNMQFNNKQFESGAAQSQRSLQNLEQTLANTAKSKGMADLGASVDGVKARFSALQIAGVTALATITTKAISSASDFLRGFSGASTMLDGFSEYETKIGSIQTIFANTGEPLKKINKYLGELNTYSDKTIYNFGDMTKNIGLFTNAGIGLADATSMIKGFSNEAATSGTNAQQAAAAAYQLSQALNAGTIRLMDWRSLQNVGMGNKNMQKSIIELATAMGKFKGKAEVAEMASKDFNGSLQEKWLTADVMSNYLKIQAGDLSKMQMKNLGLTEKQIERFTKQQKVAQDAATKVRTWTQLVGTVKEQIGSGWARTAELIIGDFNQATNLFTRINNVVGGIVGKMSNSRNAMLKEWATDKTGGGRLDFFNALGRSLSSIGKIFKAIGQAFRDAFPPSKTNPLVTFTKAFVVLSKAMVPSEGTLSGIRGIFSGLFAVLHLGVTIIKAVAGAFGSFFGILFQGTGKTNGNVLAMIGNVGSLVNAFEKWLTSGNRIVATFKALGLVAGAVIYPIIYSVRLLMDAIGALVDGRGLEGFLAPFKGAHAELTAFSATLFKSLSNVTKPFGAISDFFDKLAKKMSSMREGLGDLGLDAVNKTAETFNKTGEKISGGMTKVKRSTDAVKKSADSMYRSFSGSASSAAEKSSQTLSASAKTAQKNWDRVETVMSALGKSMKTIFTAIGKAATFIKNAFSELFGGMDALDWASLMNAIFTGGVLLAIRRFTIDFGDFVGSFKQMFDQVSDVFETLQSNLEAMQKRVKAQALMAIAIAVGVLTASVLALTFVDVKKLGISLGAIATMLGLLVGSMYALSKVNAEMSISVIAASILLLSVAIVNLSVAVAILGSLDLKTLAKGLGALGVAMAIMVASAKGMNGIKGQLIAAGAGILLISLAMNALAGAIAIIGNLSMSTLAKGLAALSISLAAMVIALKVLSGNTKGVLAAAAAIAIVSGALVSLSLAIVAFGNMDLGTLAKGFGSMAVALGLMVAALMVLGANMVGTLAAAGGMALMAAAMIQLAVAVGLFGNMDLGTLVKGFAALAVGLGLFLLAGAGAMVVGAGLLILGQTLLLFGAALALAGAGMLAFGTGFAIMAAVGTAGVAVLVAGFQAFMAMLPSFAVQVAAAFVTFIEVIAKASPRIRAAFGTILKNMLGTVRDAIPEFGKLLTTFINTGIAILQNTGPKWIEMGFTLIDAFLDSASRHAPHIADSVGKLTATFLGNLANRMGDIAEAGVKLILKFLNGMASAIHNHSEDIGKSGLDIAWALIDGLTGGLLDKGIDMVKDAVAELASHIPGPIKKILGIASPSKEAHYWGRMIGLGLANGLYASIRTAVGGAIAIANAVISAGNKMVAKAQRGARRREIASEKAQARADALAMAARRVRRSDPRESKRLKRAADAQQKRADAMQRAADAAAKRVDAAESFAGSTLHEKGDIRSSQAENLAGRALRTLARAQAEATEARRLQSINRKAARAMMAESRANARRARAFAAQARKANASANAYYAREVQNRINQIIRDRKAEDAAKKAQAEYDKADDAGKAAILQKRAEVNQKKADAANKAATSLINQAKRLAKSDADKAMALLDRAENQSKIAQDAANQAKQEKDQAAQLLKQGGGTTSGPNTGSVEFQPSRSVLEDAAKAVDRYTASMLAAEELAKAEPQPVQFVQHNTSPKALSASEIYRRTNNLLSAQEIKMGVNSN